MELLTLHKKTIIEIDDYNSFHKQHRNSDFEDLAHYISIYFNYHYIPFWEKNIKSKIDYLIDKEFKCLILSYDNGYYGLDSRFDQAYDLNFNFKKIDSYDVIINVADSEINGIKNTSGLEQMILDNKIKINDNSILITFKSGNWNPDKNQLDFYNLKLRQTFGKGENPIILKSIFSKNVFIKRIPYGPWPMDWMNWKTFPKWGEKSSD